MGINSVETLDVASCPEVSLHLVSLSPAGQWRQLQYKFVFLDFFLRFSFFALMWLSLFGDFPLGLAAMGRNFEGTLAGCSRSLHASGHHHL
jgi:hypothetical protein